MGETRQDYEVFLYGIFSLSVCRVGQELDRGGMLNIDRIAFKKVLNTRLKWESYQLKTSFWELLGR